MRNGAYGDRRYGLRSTERTAKSASRNPAAKTLAATSSRWSTSRPRSAPSEPKSRPVATRLPSTAASRAGNVVGSSGLRGSRPTPNTRSIPIGGRFEGDPPRSRSTTSRVATDCTRPADSRGMTFFQSTGETSRRTAGRGRAWSLGHRRASVDVTRVVDGLSDRVRVISWKTMRRTGTLGLSTSVRCQAIASPSRSSSVASRSSEAPPSAS